MDENPKISETLLSQHPTDPDRPSINHTDLGGEQDIYRGETPPTRQPHSPSISSVSSSPSGWPNLRLRRGPLSTVLELTINRWARARSGSSAASETSSPRLRRGRYSSPTTALSFQSESIIRARRKAREGIRLLQREFVLLLPEALAHRTSHIAPTQPSLSITKTHEGRLLRSASLSLILGQLDYAIKRSAKLRIPRRSGNILLDKGLEPWFNDYTELEPSLDASQLEAHQLHKGKAREDQRMISTGPTSQMLAINEQLPMRQAWWLDVSNPTWSDMCELGQALRLHPLTLEDILHQETREKLEHFPRLGYYFIVFRALESEHTRLDGRNWPDSGSSNDTISQYNTVSGTNVYIVVFRDGICSFHFEDISTHVDRVRSKMLKLERAVHMSSDWIAHGLLDSIVDDFFPMLDSIEQEIKHLDEFEYSGKYTPLQHESPRPNLDTTEKISNLIIVNDKEKTWADSPRPARRRTPWRQSLDGILLRLAFLSRFSGVVSLVQRLTRGIRLIFSFPEVSVAPSPLVRIASTRRLVTSLSRLLGTKSEVVTQLQKRLTNGTVELHSEPFEQALTLGVGVYFRDIQDHILTLQPSFAYHERTLNHLHHTYLSHQRASNLLSRDRMDQRVLFLSILSIADIGMQVTIGIFSSNLGVVPGNARPSRDGPPNPSIYHWFGAALVLVILTGTAVIVTGCVYWRSVKRRKLLRLIQSYAF